MSLLLRWPCLHLHSEFTANEWQMFSSLDLWPSGEIIKSGLMSEMRQTSAFWSHLHYHPNNPHVGFVDERPEHGGANAADRPLVRIQVWTGSLCRLLCGIMQPFIPGANSASCGYLAAGTMPHENPAQFRRGKWGSLRSKLAFSRATFVNAAAAELIRECMRPFRRCLEYICPVCHCELITFHLSADLVITSACHSVCPGTATLGELSLCSSGVPSTSFSVFTRLDHNLQGKVSFKSL